MIKPIYRLFIINFAGTYIYTELKARMSQSTGWGNRIFTPSTTQLGSGGGENSIAPPCTPHGSLALLGSLSAPMPARPLV